MEQIKTKNIDPTVKQLYLRLSFFVHFAKLEKCTKNDRRKYNCLTVGSIFLVFIFFLCLSRYLMSVTDQVILFQLILN